MMSRDVCKGGIYGAVGVSFVCKLCERAADERKEGWNLVPSV